MGGYLIGFLASAIFLTFSVRKFLEALSSLWRAIKISPLIVGSTVVAVGTSLPEMMVALFALIKGDVALTVGNLLGADIVMVFWVLAAGILLGRVNIGIKKTQRNGVFLASVTFLFLFFVFSWLPSLKMGFLFLILIFVFLSMEVYWGVEGRNGEDKKYVGRGKARIEGGIFGRVASCMGGVVGGGFLVVHFAERIAEAGGISTSVVGMSLLALTTTLPEILTVVFAKGEDQKKIVVGNILGTNIFNLLFLGTILGLAVKNKVEIPRESLYFLTGANLLLVLIVFWFSGKRVPRIIGWGLLTGLVFYFSWLF